MLKITFCTAAGLLVLGLALGCDEMEGDYYDDAEADAFIEVVAGGYFPNGSGTCLDPDGCSYVCYSDSNMNGQYDSGEQIKSYGQLGQNESVDCGPGSSVSWE